MCDQHQVIMISCPVLSISLQPPLARYRPDGAHKSCASDVGWIESNFEQPSIKPVLLLIDAIIARILRLRFGMGMKRPALNGA